MYRRIRYGYSFRRIPLTQGKFAIVDPNDYQRLSQHKWNAYKGYSTFYAKRKVTTGKNSTQTTIYMHRLIIEVPEGLVADHINHNGLDNRRANLRLATRAENSRNIKKAKNKFSSDYKGLYFNRYDRTWRARITTDGETRYLGHFRDEIKAALEYDKAARKYHGDFAGLNFPDAK